MKKLAALIRAGYGQGHFHRYKPWLRVTKRDHSPFSYVGHLPSPKIARLHHFRAVAERQTIQVGWWCGAVDVREQFPMWPQPHVHPATGLGDHPTIQVRGLLAIADEAQIRHGTYAGTSIPYVGSIDILTTWIRPDGSYFLVAVDNKPEHVTREPTLISRAKERLELARRYSVECQFRHVIIHAENLPKELTTNLDAIEPNAIRPLTIDSLVYAEVVDALNEYGYTKSPVEIVKQIGQRRRRSLTELYQHLRLALWRLDVDHDLTLPLDPSEPLQRGGIAVREQMRSKWFGVPTW